MIDKLEENFAYVLSDLSDFWIGLKKTDVSCLYMLAGIWDFLDCSFCELIQLCSEWLQTFLLL